MSFCKGLQGRKSLTWLITAWVGLSLGCGFGASGDDDEGSGNNDINPGVCDLGMGPQGVALPSGFPTTTLGTSVGDTAKDFTKCLIIYLQDKKREISLVSCNIKPESTSTLSSWFWIVANSDSRISTSRCSCPRTLSTNLNT